MLNGVYRPADSGRRHLYVLMGGRDPGTFFGIYMNIDLFGTVKEEVFKLWA